MTPPTSLAFPLLVAVVLVAAGIPALLLGASIQARCFARLRLPASMFVLISLATTSAIGYVLFWCYFANVRLGFAGSLIALAVPVVSLYSREGRRRLKRLLVRADVALPLVMMFAAAFFYLCLQFGTWSGSLPEDWRWSTHLKTSGMLKSVDNHIPAIFASRLFHGVDLRYDLLMGRSSDRPPLQAAILLIEYPIWNALADALGNRRVIDAYYQALATLLQCVWIPAAYALMAALRLPRAKICAVLLGLIPSYFFFINSVFVWPKLLAAGLALGSITLLGPWRRRGSLATRQMLVAAGLAALALLAHQGAALTFIGFGLVLLLPRFFPGWRNVFVGALLMAAVLTPWLSYRQFFDPPGNYLTKTHLAGVGVRQDPQTTLGAISRAYGQLSVSDLLDRKYRKLRFIAGLDREPSRRKDPMRTVRNNQNLRLLPALGALNVGWVVVALGCFIARPALKQRLRMLGLVLGIALVCVLLWIALLLSSPINQHTSYATVTLLFVGLGASIVIALPRGIILLLFGAHLVVSAAAYLGYASERAYSVPSLAAAGLTYAILVVVCRMLLNAPLLSAAGRVGKPSSRWAP